VATSTYRI